MDPFTLANSLENLRYDVNLWELIRLATILVIQSIELVTVLLVGLPESVDFDDFCGNHASYDRD